jgi:DNA-directed RNA polymerase specialized sigma subunit
MGRSRIDGFIRLLANVLEKGCTLAKVTDKLMREGNVSPTIEQIAERCGKQVEQLRAAAMAIGTNRGMVRLDAPVRLEEEGGVLTMGQGSSPRAQPLAAAGTGALVRGRDGSPHGRGQQ